MKIGHSFHPMHGFTGSAKPMTDMRPSIPGYKRGGMPEVEHGEHEHGDHPKHKEHHMKHGGMAKHHGGHKKHHGE